MASKDVTRIAPVFSVVFCLLALCACERRESGPAGSSSTAPSPGGSVKMVFIPKSKGIPYYESMYPEFERAAKELDARFDVAGPAKTDATSQIPIIKDQVQQGVNAILIAPNSADALNRELDAARSKGVKVISVNQDMPGSESHRDAAVLPVDFDAVGASQIELLGSLIDYEGKFAILSATTNAPDQNYWIEGMKQALKDPKYAKMQLLDIVYGDDKPEKSRKEADALLTQYPDLRAILAPTSVGVEQAAKAVQSRGVYPGGPNAANAAGGKGVVVSGLGIPNQMRGYLKDGIIQKVALWDPPGRVAYVSAHLGAGLANGTIQLGEGNTFMVPELGEFRFRKNNVVIAGRPLVFTKENVDEYNF